MWGFLHFTTEQYSLLDYASFSMSQGEKFTGKVSNEIFESPDLKHKSKQVSQVKRCHGFFKNLSMFTEMKSPFSIAHVFGVMHHSLNSPRCHRLGGPVTSVQGSCSQIKGDSLLRTQPQM